MFAVRLIRLVTLALVLVALLELEWPAPPAGVEVAFVVDRSQSIAPAQRTLALDVVNAACRTLDPARDRARLIVFGGDARPEAVLERGQPVESVSSVIADERTDVENALRLAAGSFQPGRRRRIVLVTDGNETDGDALRAVVPATRVDVVPLEYAYAGDVLVEKLVVPARVKAREPFRVRVVLHAERPVRARVRLLREHRELDARTVELPRGTSVETFDVTVPSGGASGLTARVEPLDPDDVRTNLPQNDEASALVAVEGARRILYVHRGDEDGPSRPLLEALRREGLEVESVVPAGLGRGAGRLESADAILLDDVPASDFTEEQMRALEFAVNEEGIGLAMLGGESSFGAGGWQGTLVERLLPVECEPKQTVIRSSLALVLCLDRSGSMTGATADGATKLDLAKEGVLLAARRLASSDQVGVVAFDQTAEWVAPLLPRAGNEASLERAVKGMGAGGGTDLVAGLDESIRALEKAEAAVKHLVLLTDGLSEGDFAPLLARCKAAKVTVSTIGVGTDADQRLLGWIASAGSGKHYVVERASSLPRVFLQETQRVARALLDEDRFTPAVSSSSELVRDIAAWPPLRGHVRTEAKPSAEVALTACEGEPLLATMASGVGRTLAFTSDARARWASEWVRWSGFAPFFARAVRSIARGVEDERLQASVRLDGSVAKVTLDAIDEQGRVVDGLVVATTVRAPSGARVGVELRGVGPGRYEGSFRVGESGPHAIVLQTRDARGATRALTTGVVVPVGIEFRKASSDAPRLAAIARAGGGRVVAPHEVIDGRARLFFADELPEAEGSRPLAPVALILALILFLADVAIRKLGIDSHFLEDWQNRRKDEPGAPPEERKSERAADLTRRLLDAKRRARGD